MSETSGSSCWRRSSRCDSGSCVDVAVMGDFVGVRQSTDPSRVLHVSRAAFADLVAGIKRGEF